MADGADRRGGVRRIGADEARVLLAIAEAATPAGRHVRAPDARTVDAVEAVLERFGPSADRAWLTALHALDLAAIPLSGARLSSLPIAARTGTLARLAQGVATHGLVRGVTAPLKLAQVIVADPPESLGARVGLSTLPVVDERPRWHERMLDAREMSDGETLEADVVIVGSGAGGGPVARALASEGYAVVVLEEGGYFSRGDFSGRAWERGLAMQRQRGVVGNTFIAMPTGVTVGGSTTINSGTCLRTPADVLRRWRFEDGLTGLDPEVMEPFFAKVEAALEVGVPSASVLGGSARVVARGASALGWSHGPLARNAPGCDGQGLCCFGCPTGAKSSTNVSYLPAAMRAGAVLAHHCRVEEVLLAGGRAVGVLGRAVGGGARIRVLAKTVVLSGGTIGTPLMLLRQGLANRSGQVGRNLTVHPASNAWADFDERIAGWEGIPQSYGIDEFTPEGIRFEGAFVPLDVAAATVSSVGPAWTDFVDRFDHLACFGFMIAESSRGRVSLGPDRSALLTYRMNDVDRRKILRGHGLLARLLLAGGAREVHMGVRGWERLRSEREVERFEREAPSSVAAHQLELAAFHPLGTCRMGADASRSVVGPTHETHDVPGLFVVDGSCVNGPLGVNPQVTIMALAERASGFIARHADSASRPQRRRAPPPPRDAQVEFTETMGGRCQMLASGRDVAASFTVRAAAGDGASLLRSLLREGAVLALDGAATIEGMALRSPCEGTLTLRPLRRIGTLVYDLRFAGDDGVEYLLHGEKSVRLATVLSGMTTLVTEVARAADGVPVARGTLRFALGDVLPWLTTWRVRGRASVLP
ncbi:MAG: GMC family oxidoreductase [Deltaproteobacteria bacterium]|nr:GMC family oxidoreductase [Deltaproteobacteria bacterium]